MSRDSGAVSYSQPTGMGAWSCFRSSSVNREVVRALVAAGLFLADLHQDVVQERGSAEAVEVRREPVDAKRLVGEHQVLDRLLRVADAAGGLEADAPAGFVVDVADRLEHHERDRERGRRGQLAGGGL